MLNQQPWSFNKSLVVMRDFDWHSTLDFVEMSWCPFWVKIHGIPLGMMHEKVAYAIGRSIGEVIEVDNGGDKTTWEDA